MLCVFEKVCYCKLWKYTQTESSRMKYVNEFEAETMYDLLVAYNNAIENVRKQLVATSNDDFYTSNKQVDFEKLAQYYK